MIDFYLGLYCWEIEIDFYCFLIFKDYVLIQGGIVMFGVVYLEMVFVMLKDKFVDVIGLELCDVKFFSFFILLDIQVFEYNQCRIE